MPFDKKAYMKEYREKNKDYLRECGRKYREKDPRVEYKREYNIKHKDRLNECRKLWDKTPRGIKSNKTKVWKKIGIRCNDEWEEVYDWYSCSTNCDICNKPFTASIDKCLDHDHHLDGYNIRGILCKKCNHHTNEL
tara:strand:+ start:54 stop:461 length:408 start_codon:yes stop_codon:yes gene_type:complete